MGEIKQLEIMWGEEGGQPNIDGGEGSLRGCFEALVFFNQVLLVDNSRNANGIKCYWPMPS